MGSGQPYAQGFPFPGQNPVTMPAQTQAQNPWGQPSFGQPMQAPQPQQFQQPAQFPGPLGNMMNLFRQGPPSAMASSHGAPTDATAMLRMMMGHPQLQQALQWASVLGPSAPRTVDLSVPGATSQGGPRNVSVPLGAAMNALSSLLGRSLMEVNANTNESDPEVPEYLVDDEGEFVVDPADADARAALVAHLFRIDAQVRRRQEAGVRSDTADSDADAWARDLGF